MTAAVTVPGVYWQNNSTALCLLGGVVVGTVVSIRMLIFGRVTGISGIMGMTFALDPSKVSSAQRFASLCFICGLVAGGAIANTYISECFEDWGPLGWPRLIIAAFLIGFGTSLGNGCTSGHGICGISNLRVRSFVATATFMITAMVVAMASDTSAYLPFFTNTQSTVMSGALPGFAILSCLVLLLLGVLLKKKTTVLMSVKEPVQGGALTLGGGLRCADVSHTLVKGAFDFVFGTCFAIAMAVSNMTKLSATISFLDLRYWNPALAFVMMGAICISSLSFFFTFKFHSEPLLDVKFYLPALSKVDKKLVSGSAIFGVGWGLAGACPAPAITNLASGHIYPPAYVAAIVVGYWCEQLFESKVLSKLAAKTDANIAVTSPCACADSEKALVVDINNSLKDGPSEQSSSKIEFDAVQNTLKDAAVTAGNPTAV